MKRSDLVQAGGPLASGQHGHSQNGSGAFTAMSNLQGASSTTTSNPTTTALSGTVKVQIVKVREEKGYLVSSPAEIKATQGDVRFQFLPEVSRA